MVIRSKEYGQDNQVNLIFHLQVTLVVNVASMCGYTEGHYKGLNLLNKKFSHTGKFNILAFPCNQFGEQEPGVS